MPHGRGDAIPLEALRDLLAIVRALFAAGLQNKGQPIDLEALREIGSDLATALDLAARCEPDTLGHVAAWNRAERATKALGELIDRAMPLRPVLDAAVARAMMPSKGPRPNRPPRDAKLEQRKRRG
jgi:hypothetical protein